MNAHVSPSGFPALVLNADFRPLSYYPLSLWSWQDAIKAVFLERVNIVANYDRAVHSPSFEMKLPSVVSLKTYVKPSTHPAFTRFNVFLRDRFSCQYCGDARRPDLRSPAAALARRPHDLGQRRRRLLALQSAQGQPDAGRSQDVAVADGRSSRRCSTCTATAGCSRRTICTIAGSIISTGIPSSIRKPCRPAPRVEAAWTSDLAQQVWRPRCCRQSAVSSLCLPAKAGATSAMKRAISSLTCGCGFRPTLK